MVKGGSRIYTGRASRRRGGRPPSGRGTTSNPGPAQPSLRWAARERPARFGRRPPPWLAVEGYPPGPGRPRRCLRPTSRMPRARFRLDSMSGRAARAWPGLLAGAATALARVGGRDSEWRSPAGGTACGPCAPHARRGAGGRRGAVQDLGKGGLECQAAVFDGRARSRGRDLGGQAPALDSPKSVMNSVRLILRLVSRKLSWALLQEAQQKGSRSRREPRQLQHLGSTPP